MKKIYSVILTIILSVSLYASEEALLKAHKATVFAVHDLDMKTLLEYTHPEYVGISSDGTVSNYSEFKAMIPAINSMKNIASGKYSLLDLMEVAAWSEGKSLSKEEREQIKAEENTAEAKKIIAESEKEFIPNVKSLVKSLVKELKDSCTTHKLLICTTSGNVGTVVYKMKDFESGKMELCVEMWEKTECKWLMKKSVNKFDE